MKKAISIALVLAYIVVSIGFVGKFFYSTRLSRSISKGQNIRENSRNISSVPLFLWNVPVLCELMELRIPLVEACYYRNEQAVEVLLANGADPDFFAAGYFSPLEAAIISSPTGLVDERSYNILKLLVEAGADMNHPYMQDSIIYQVASMLSGDSQNQWENEMFFYLLENGATLDERVMLYCIWSGDTAVVRALVSEYGFDVTSQVENQTYLIKAVDYPYVNKDMVELLLECGVDANYVDIEGKTAWDYARIRKHEHLYELFE